MTPIQEAYDYRPPQFPKREEKELAYFLTLLNQGKIYSGESGIFIDNEAGLPYLRELGPVNTTELDTSEALRKMGVNAFWRKEPPVIQLAVASGGENAGLRLWHGASKLSKGSSLLEYGGLSFPCEMSIAIAGLGIMPVGHLEKIKTQGLVIKSHASGAIFGLFPGKMVGIDGPSDLLYPTARTYPNCKDNPVVQLLERGIKPVSLTFGRIQG